ncbi:MAG: hypothetical protein ACXACU_12670 [Candidatus Hodarchaeales archaeon]
MGKPDQTYIIGKRWVKKNIPKSKRISKLLHENSEYGDIYDIGMHFLPNNPDQRVNLWLCMETGTVLKSAPKLKKPMESKIRSKIAAKPKLQVSRKKPIVKTTTAPKPEPKPEPVPEIIAKPVKKASPKKASSTTLTSVSEVKGIGKAAFEKLAAVNINTIGDLISKHSQEIATLIGRKSDSQVKKWQDNAREMLK